MFIPPGGPRHHEDPELAARYHEQPSILERSRVAFAGLAVAILLLVIASIVGHFL